jgi:glycosyltransferase involved in cell wall biosynthesis
LKGDRIILDFHELFPEFMMQHKPNLNYTSLIIKSLILIEKLSFGFATHIITFHDPAREILLKRIKQEKPVVTIMNGVDKTELPVFNKIKSEEFRIVYNGTINFNLNLSLVIKALNIIKIRYPEVYDKIGFYLYGEGPDIGNIKKKASQLNIKNVYFKGRFKFTDMMKELEQASVCILPPKKDIYSDLYYSLKLTEMIYFRIPVIATRLDTYHSYYPEDCLIYFNSDDCEDLAKKILFVYSNSKIETYTDNAFKQYSNYSWDIMKLRYQSLINSI